MVRNDKYRAFWIRSSNTLHVYSEPFNISFIFRIMAFYNSVINITEIRNFHSHS
jgi:hypothetical protein